MKKFDKILTSVDARLRFQQKVGRLEPGQYEEAAKALKALWHALKVGDMRQAQAAANDLAKVFLRAEHV